jgi:DNA mismatch endonuclease, patch repair protein
MERYLRLKLPDGKFLNVTASRSRTMSAIRGKHGKTTERALRMALIRAGIRGWRLHAALPGKPDIFFDDQRIAVFVDGCFWHFCPKCGHIPRTRQAFWKAKIERNMRRDRRTKRILRQGGIRVIRVWEHSLKSSKDIDSVIKLIKNLNVDTGIKVRQQQRRNKGAHRAALSRNAGQSLDSNRVRTRETLRNSARQ